jgi:tRNA pseudouridine55 synthase
VVIHAHRHRRLAGSDLVIDVSCSKGTYIRTLAEDIGTGTGLRRPPVGAAPHRQPARWTWRAPSPSKQLAALDEAARAALLQPADVLLAAMARGGLPDDEAGRFLTGLRRRVALADAPAVRVYGPHPRAFLGAAHITAGELIADRLLSPLEVQAAMA